MKTQFTSMLAAAALGLLATACLAAAQTYTITDLGVDTMPYAVNDFGQVAGALSYPATRNNPSYARGFIWTAGVRTQFGTLGGPTSVARSINLYGQVVGYADTSSVSGSARAFLWESGTGMRNLNLVAGPNGTTAASLGWVLTSAYAINDYGQIVGRGGKTGETSSTDGYIWQKDADGNVSVQRVNLGVPQNGNAETRGLNNAGQVVGAVPNEVVINNLGQTWTYPYASLWQRDLNGLGYNVHLGLLDGRQSIAFSINNYGEVVGFADRTDGRSNAFYWSDANRNGVSDPGEMVSLGTLGGMQSVANTINDAGQVVGWAHDAGGTQRAFVWDEVNGMRDLNKLGNSGSSWFLKSARAISNTGRIIGSGSFKVKNNTQNRGFVLTP